MQYHLAHSFRFGKHVKKARVFLGSDLSPDQFEQKRKSDEGLLKASVEEAQIIHDPFLTALSPSELKQLETLEPRGKLQVLHLSERDWEKFKEVFAYNTNAIEGSRVEAPEVVGILTKKEWPKDKTNEEISETYGVAEAVDYIRSIEEHFSIELTKDLHRIVLKNSLPYVGNFEKRV